MAKWLCATGLPLSRWCPRVSAIKTQSFLVESYANVYEPRHYVLSTRLRLQKFGCIRIRSAARNLTKADSIRTTRSRILPGLALLPTFPNLSWYHLFFCVNAANKLQTAVSLCPWPRNRGGGRHYSSNTQAKQSSRGHAFIQKRLRIKIRWES